MYLVGSSKNITGGFVNNSRPIDSLFFSPPDNFPTGVFITFSRPRSASISLTCHNNLYSLARLHCTFYSMNVQSITMIDALSKITVYIL